MVKDMLEEFGEILGWLFHPDELMDFVVSLLLWICLLALGGLTVACGHDLWFESHHQCVRTDRFWEEGHFVGVVGKGGYWQPAGWHYYCAQWTPSDGGDVWIR